MSATLAPPADPRRGRWIPWAIVAFFAVVAAVNLVMIWLAISTWPGLETDRAYEEGLAYNRTLDAKARQDALGWQGEITGRITAGFDAELTLRVRDADGAPLTGAVAVVRLLRPTSEGHDLVADLHELGAGSYRAAVTLPLAGIWDAEVTVVRGEDRWVAQRRLTLR